MKQKYLNDHELSKFQEILSRYELTNPRDVSLLRLTLETGARASEILSIRISDLDPFDKTVFITAKKQGRSRLYPLSANLFSSLIRLSEGLSGDERLFPISYHRMRQIWVMYRPAEKKLHSLRHTKAIVTYKKTLDMKLVQQVLGHKSMSSTEVYTEFLYTSDQLRRAMGV